MTQKQLFEDRILATFRLAVIQLFKVVDGHIYLLLATLMSLQNQKTI